MMAWGQCSEVDDWELLVEGWVENPQYHPMVQSDQPVGMWSCPRRPLCFQWDLSGPLSDGETDGKSKLAYV